VREEERDSAHALVCEKESARESERAGQRARDSDREITRIARTLVGNVHLCDIERGREGGRERESARARVCERELRQRVSERE